MAGSVLDDPHPEVINACHRGEGYLYYLTDDDGVTKLVIPLIAR